MPNIALDWTTVDWANVGLLSAIAFLAALLGNILIFKHRLWAAILAGLLFAAAYVFLAYYPHGLTVPGLKTGARKAAVVVGLNLTSPEIAPGATIQNEQVYRGFDCNGTNISPELRWSGAPSTAKSFTVTLYDPDAPTGSGWWHWVIVNIAPTTTFLPRNAGDPKMGLAPPGTIQIRTDFGTVGYGRQAASFRVHHFRRRRRQAPGRRECVRGARRFQSALPYVDQGDADRLLRPLTASAPPAFSSGDPEDPSRQIE